MASKLASDMAADRIQPLNPPPPYPPPSTSPPPPYFSPAAMAPSIRPLSLRLPGSENQGVVLDTFNFETLLQLPPSITSMPLRGISFPLHPSQLQLFEAIHFKRELGRYQHEFVRFRFRNIATPSPNEPNIFVVAEREAGEEYPFKNINVEVDAKDTLSVLTTQSADHYALEDIRVEHLVWGNTGGPSLEDVLSILHIISTHRSRYSARKFNCYYLARVTMKALENQVFYGQHAPKRVNMSMDWKRSRFIVKKLIYEHWRSDVDTVVNLFLDESRRPPRLQPPPQPLQPEQPPPQQLTWEQRVDAMEHRMDAMEHRMDAMEHRMDAMEQRIVHRMDAMEQRLGQHVGTAASGSSMLMTGAGGLESLG